MVSKKPSKIELVQVSTIAPVLWSTKFSMIHTCTSAKVTFHNFLELFYVVPEIIYGKFLQLFRQLLLHRNQWHKTQNSGNFVQQYEPHIFRLGNTRYLHRSCRCKGGLCGFRTAVENCHFLGSCNIVLNEVKVV